MVASVVPPNPRPSEHLAPPAVLLSCAAFVQNRDSASSASVNSSSRALKLRRFQNDRTTSDLPHLGRSTGLGWLLLAQCAEIHPNQQGSTLILARDAYFQAKARPIIIAGALRVGCSGCQRFCSNPAARLQLLNGQCPRPSSRQLFSFPSHR